MADPPMKMKDAERPHDSVMRDDDNNSKSSDTSTKQQTRKYTPNLTDRWFLVHHPNTSTNKNSSRSSRPTTVPSTPAPKHGAPTAIHLATHALHGTLKHLQAAFPACMNSFIFPHGLAEVPPTTRLSTRTTLAGGVSVIIFVANPGGECVSLGCGSYRFKVWEADWPALVEFMMEFVTDEGLWRKHGYRYKRDQWGRLRNKVDPAPLTVLKVMRAYLEDWWVTIGKKDCEEGRKKEKTVEGGGGGEGEGESGRGKTAEEGTDASAAAKSGAVDKDGGEGRGRTNDQEAPQGAPEETTATKEDNESWVLVDGALTKLDRWADLWLKGDLEGDEDWETLSFCHVIPDE